MNFEDLKNPDLQERLRAAKTPEELLAIAKEEGFGLSDAQPEGVAGGGWYCDDACKRFDPHCSDGPL